MGKIGSNAVPPAAKPYEYKFYHRAVNVMKTYLKKDYTVSNIRRYLEPGPVVLVSSTWQGKSNIMTMGWHMMLEFSPALFGCSISNRNYSF